MDSSSSNSSGLQISGSEEDLRLLMDQRKRKRMISNRESARRSRIRKQKHLDDLMAQVTQLRKDNQHILTSLNVTTQQFASVESENAILRAQAAELSNRLQSLNDIAGFMSGGFVADKDPPPQGYGTGGDLMNNGFVNNSWNCVSQPIVLGSASADAGFMF